jgi:hypothetical protein
VRRVATLLGLAGLACVHGDPFQLNGADSLGPASAPLPRRLTYNPGDDRSPTLAGTDVVYSRFDPSRGTSAQCLARLPVEGGTLRTQWCPPGPTPTDTLVSTWLEPALADDGTIAYVWERGPRVSALAAWSHHLVVAPAGTIGAPSLQIFLSDSLGGRFYNTAYELSWAGPGRLRFLGAYQFIPKVKGGGPARFTDTTLIPAGLMELDLASGTLGEVPGGAGVTAYAPAPDGALWVVRADTLWRLDQAGVAVPLTAVGPFVSDLAQVDGRALLARSSPVVATDSTLTWEIDSTLTWWDPVSAATGELVTPGPVHRLTAVGGRRFVAEVEADGRVFGAPANLWLFELPAR